MDSQVPAGYPDILGLLSEKSLIKIKAVQSAAVAELLPALSHTIESVAVDMDTLMEHHPSEFFHAFERFTERQYDGYAEELLPHFSDVERYVVHLASNVTNRISNEIRPEPKFMRPGGFLEEWTQSALQLQDLEKAETDLSVSSGDWETYIERCLQRHLFEYAALSRRHSDREINEDMEGLGFAFRLKYKFHFRRRTQWSTFEWHLRAHLSNRLAHWKAEADKHAASRADVVIPESAPTILLSMDGTERSEAIKIFILKMAEAGRAIKKNHIWMAAGYRNATEFERFQRDDPRTTRSAVRNLTRVLSMDPEEFFPILDKMSAK